jgi:hypothetical protein
VITRLFSARVATLVFGIAYAIAVYVDVPLFRYYPLVQRWSLHDLATQSLGPAMSWYGWIATAAIPAVVLALLVPNRNGERIPAAVFWLVPLVMFAAGWYHERAWFQ